MKKRFLSASIFLPAIIILNIAGNVYFVSLISLTAFAAAYECNKILQIRNTPSIAVLSGSFSAALVIIIYWVVTDSAYAHITSLTILILSIASMIWMLFYLESTSILVGKIAGLIAPAIYTGGILSMTVLLRAESHGLIMIFYLITLTSAADSGAYFIGKFIGKTPFFQQVSPSKTWEGAIGAILCSIAASVLFTLVVSKMNIANISTIHSITVGIIVGFIGQIGDLYESSMKRKSNLKDSGALIPGHGGILDRIDSVIFNIPVIYYSVQWLIE